MKFISRPYQVLLAASLVGVVLTGCNQRAADETGAPDAADTSSAPDTSSSAGASTVSPGTDATATGASGDVGSDTTGVTPEMGGTESGETSVAPIPDTNPPMDSAGTSGAAGMSNTDPESTGAPATSGAMDDQQPVDNMNAPSSGTGSTP